jgi:hypothetical protein
MTQQEKEIATIKPRTFEIRLSDADYQRIAEKAAIAEMSVEELLESFIGDLVNGTYTNGSDERMHANDWYERCGYGCFEKSTFLHYLINEYSVNEFVDAWDSAEDYKEDADNTEKEIENPMADWKNFIDSNGNQVYASKESYLSELQEELKEMQDYYKSEMETVEEYWNNFLTWTDSKNPDKDKEIKAVLYWHAKYTPAE